MRLIPRRGGAGPAQGDGRDRRRLRDCPARPGDSRAGRIPGRPPVRRGDAAVCRSGNRRRVAGLGARGGALDAGPASRDGRAACAALVGGKAEFLKA